MQENCERGRFGALGGIRSVAGALLLAAAVAVSSCGVFDTREPNPPGGEESTPRKSPINVDAVLYNYTMAVEYGDRGQYEETLAEDFRFFPDEADRDYFIGIGGGDIFLGWGVDAEMTAVQRILSDSESLTVSFDEETRDDWEPDSVLVRLDYVFRERLTEDSVAVFKGFAEIHLVPDNQGFWSIDRWTDKETVTDFLTWGRLKGSTVAGGSATLQAGLPVSERQGLPEKPPGLALTGARRAWYNTAGVRVAASAGARTSAVGPPWRESQ